MCGLSAVAPTGPPQPAWAEAEGAKVEIVPDNLKERRPSARGAPTGQLNTLQTVVSRSTHPAAVSRACVVAKNNLWSSLTAD